ncbi:hypothetical protein [Robertkochia aurantiaca]|uniref:hypothetical protein n=1 Tax=Robertkochia aurantiaca TaxID=2873700 RepID=UPI001CC8FDF0|nr:hypothetical protein [Robertkochia sp. 3YJGBD-33]
MSDLEKKVLGVSAHRDSREKLAKEILDNERNLKRLFELALLPDTARKSLWILEMIGRTAPLQLIKYEEQLKAVFKEKSPMQAKRSLAKIAEMITLSSSPPLSENLKNILIEFCFDILIYNATPAEKVFAMTALANLSEKEAWIKNELRAIIDRDYASESPAFRARARILQKKWDKSEAGR